MDAGKVLLVSERLVNMPVVQCKYMHLIYCILHSFFCDYQGMCVHRSIDNKAQELKVPGFPKGWKFAFDQLPMHPAGGPFIVLISPNKKKFDSLGKAKRAYRTRLANATASELGSYVGVAAEALEGSAVTRKGKPRLRPMCRVKSENGQVRANFGV
jgi:hypothetical protein